MAILTKLVTSFFPMSPVPPITTIFMFFSLVEGYTLQLGIEDIKYHILPAVIDDAFAAEGK